MTADLRWFWARLNANYWFYPSLFALVGGVLGFVLVYVDRAGVADQLNELAWLIPARPAGASNQLSVIAAAMIAVASTVFSITIVAVSYASGTYGPRLLTNFMEDKGNQLSLATFIGTFVYAITVLRAVRGEDESATNLEDAASTALPGFVPQLSLIVAYLLMVFAVGVLVYFLNHVPSAIRINNVLEGIGKRLIRAVVKTYPDKGASDDTRERPSGTPLFAKKSGYVQLIEFDELAKIGAKHDCDVVLQVRTGDFVHPGMTLLEVNGDCDPEELEDRLREQFTLGAARTPEQDPQFLVDELVEIGLRALSPGVNDPFTAITALHWLGAATAELGTRRLEKDLCDEEAGECRVYPLSDNFAHYVERGFGTIRSAVATSPTAAQVMLDVLRNVAAPVEDDARIAILLREGYLLLVQARCSLAGPDLAKVEQAFIAFNRAISPNP